MTQAVPDESKQLVTVERLTIALADRCLGVDCPIDWPIIIVPSGYTDDPIRNVTYLPDYYKFVWKRGKTCLVIAVSPTGWIQWCLLVEKDGQTETFSSPIVPGEGPNDPNECLEEPLDIDMLVGLVVTHFSKKK